MIKPFSIFAIAFFLAFQAPPASADFQPLSTEQIKVLFENGLEFTTNPLRSNIRFKFRKNGKWYAEDESGYEAWGTWRLNGPSFCTELDGSDGRSDWGRVEDQRSERLRRVMGCSAINAAGSEKRQVFVWSKAGFKMELEDPELAKTVIALTPKSATDALAEERKRLEAEKRTLERERLALRRERRSEGVRQTPIPTVPGIEFGRYHALVIGIDNYESLPTLKTAKADAQAVARILHEKYGYEVRLLENATRSAIIDALDDYRDTLEEHDNLLIYYAGHGWLDKETGRGYWLPLAARQDRRSNWFSNASLTDALHAIDAKHVMVVADSCYAGSLTRSLTNETPKRDDGYFARMAEKRTRVVLTSGGLEPVLDSGGGRHSVFASQFLKVLAENDRVLDGTLLFDSIRRGVVLNADQTPEYSDIRRAGHEGGDFLFVPQN